MNVRRLAALALGASLMAGCRQDPKPAPPRPISSSPTPDASRAPAPAASGPRRLARFTSADDFDRFLREAREEHQRRVERIGLRSRRAAEPSAAAPAGPANPATPSQAPSEKKGGADESITNNQEEGVDEGDIVKVSGDFFIVLRRGRLFTVRQREAGLPAFAPVSRINAFPAGGSRGTWYDEMLVYRDLVVVIGFSYQVGGTEIGLFRLWPDGRLSHHATHFLRSNDYYSARNYAGRLVGSKLIFYMPFFLNYQRQGPVQLPAVATWSDERKGVVAWNDVLSKLEVYRPIQRTSSPTLHTIVQCDLARPEFSCTARALVGPYSRTFYVSRDAVYVWISPSFDYWASPDEQKQVRREGAYVYRLPILAGEVQAVRASGSPIDQFSFKESREDLHVLVTDQGDGDAMWQTEAQKGQLALARIPLQLFSAEPAMLPAGAYTRLPSIDHDQVRLYYHHIIQNRFVGDWLLWGAGASGWGTAARNGGTLFATSVKQPAAIKRLSLDHGVERIEAMGRNAVVVGSGKQDLFFTSIELGETPTVRSAHVRPNAAQGETRSHGFFFLPQGDAAGLLGLPVRTNGRPGLHLQYGSAEIAFLRVSPELKLSPIGSLVARAERTVNDGCQVSCVDWYGNARPIFFRGRIFALLGYELVEGTLAGDSLHEKQRIDYLQPRLAER